MIAYASLCKTVVVYEYNPLDHLRIIALSSSPKYVDMVLKYTYEQYSQFWNTLTVLLIIRKSSLMRLLQKCFIHFGCNHNPKDTTIHRYAPLRVVLPDAWLFDDSLP